MSDLRDDLHERLALIASADAMQAVGLTIDELIDPDARAEAIRADHSEYQGAIADGRDHITVAGNEVDVQLHLAMHEIIASQLADDSPPEVWATAKRLLAAGYDRHEALHMLAWVISGQIHAALTAEAEYDEERHVAALRALPASWERQRAREQVEVEERSRSRKGRAPKRRRR